MKTTILLLTALSGIVCYAADRDALPYRLVWDDEFSADGRPDPENWTYEYGFVRNHELQWYQPENAYCTNGLLVIEGRREKKENPQYREGSRDWKRSRRFIEYTSACLITRGLHSWQYGRFEIRARIRTEEGLWPAIWFLGINGSWPHNGEVDLMEYYDGHILANACWGTDQQYKAVWDSVKTPLKEFGDPAFQDQFHIWRMDWDKEFIHLYLDDRLLNTIDLSKARNPDDRWGPVHPFQQPQYLLLNLALGGDQGGDPSGTVFPSRYEIDYVRVYQALDGQTGQP